MDRKEYQRQYHAANKLRTAQRVAKHRRHKKNPHLKADVTTISSNTRIDKEVCNNNVTTCNNKSFVLDELRRKTSDIINKPPQLNRYQPKAKGFYDDGDTTLSYDEDTHYGIE